MNEERNYWCVFITKPLAEKKVAERLQLKDLKSFLPLQIILKQWYDKTNHWMSSLFPSSIFIRRNEFMLSIVFSIQGIGRLLHCVFKFLIIKKYKVEYLKILLSDFEELNRKKAEYIFQAGQNVVVLRPPFKKLITSSVSLNGKHRKRINIESTGTNFVMNIPKSFVPRIIDKAA